MLRGRIYESNKSIQMCPSKKVKRYRSAFTTSQINYLEKQYEKCPYIGSAVRKEVANMLNISERAIKIWFQNRRMKEKKEQYSKEFNMNHRDNTMNNIKFTKDSLNNIHSLQSTNDRQYSLQSSLGKQSNYINYYNDTKLSNQIRSCNLKKDTINNCKPYNMKADIIANNIKQDILKQCMPESVRVLHNNLRKDNIDKNVSKYTELHKKDTSKTKVMPKPLKVTSQGDSVITDPILYSSLTLPRYQDSPQDLSTRNLTNKMMPPNHQGNVQLSAFIPFCNTQNVCLSTGNVIWKAVNVTPGVLSNTLPATVPKRQPNTNKNGPEKCKCSCDCRSKNRINFDRGNIVEPQPQYIIAVPYNNLSMLR